MIKKKVYSIMLVLSVCVAICGCTGKSNNKDSETTGKIVEETTTEAIDYNNPLGIEGYTYYGEDNLVNDKDVAMVAKIEAEASIDELFVNSISLHKCDENEIVAEYSLGDNLEKYEIHIAKLEANTHEVVKDIIVGDGFSSYTTRVSNGTLCTHDSDEEKKLIKYNDDLQEEYVIEMDNEDGISSGIMSSDGNKIYYATDGWLKVCNVQDKENITIDHKYNMYVDYISGVITDDSGNDYVMMSVYMGDFKQYTCIMNASTKEIKYLKTAENSDFSSVENNIYVNNLFDDETGASSCIVTGKNGKTFSYVPKDLKVSENVKVLYNGDLLFESFLNGKLNISIYDTDSGEIKGRTSFEVPLEKVTDEGETIDYAYLMQTPVYINENQILLFVSDNMFNTLIYKWDISKATEESMYDVAAYTISADKIDEYDDTNAVTLLRKSECSEEFKPLLEIANKMEDKYGVDIFIEKEAGRILDVYALFPLENYSEVETSLEYLNEELSKYPEGFFEQFVYSENKGIDIHISSGILLMDREADNLDVAGGVHNTDTDGNIVIALDCGDDPSIIKQSLHHEISHAIDTRIEFYMDTFEEEWNKLNPSDLYMYSYNDYASEVYNLGLDKYVYDYLYMEDKQEESYYLDNYSLTYPTEDRARLFENIMNDDTWYPDYSELPHIENKMNYYAEVIRETFDTTGWENVEWERYLIDN